MILLQAAIAAGLILLVIFGVYMLIGIPLLTMLLMKAYWKISNQQEKIKNKIPYYKDTYPFILSVAVALSILIFGFYLFIILLDKVFPSFGYSN
jgi:hypothetical protein